MSEFYLQQNRSEWNHSRNFWQVGEEIFNDEDWDHAFSSLKKEFGDFEGSLLDFLNWTLTERRFDPKPWGLRPSLRLFYGVKPYIPRIVQVNMRRLYKHSQKKNRVLHWPIEHLYTRFQKTLLWRLLANKGLSEVPYIRFWQKGNNFAFVLTHDVETEEGYKNIPKLVEMDRKYGFRSSFNIVPRKYKIDVNYLAELRAEGFEIGLHGLKHDGKLFWSERVFAKRAKIINRFIRDWNVNGFRSPFSHRNPSWMEKIDCDYDMSFFDTDPYEPIPGGTMSIWPFFLPKFVELPYTLAQDFSLFMVRQEVDIDIWREKIDYIEKEGGMALVIIHPDYLSFENTWKINKYPVRLYEELLSYVKAKEKIWNVLPKEIAEWWSARACSTLIKRNGEWKVNPYLEGAEIGTIRSDNMASQQ